MTYKLVMKDAFRQIFWRIVSALAWFIVIILITPYLWTLRYWDYWTIISYFAFISSLADLGLYSLWLKELWEKVYARSEKSKDQISILYSKVVWSRLFLIFVVYTFALIIAYFIPSYRENPYLFWGLPLGMFFSAVFMSAGIIQLPLQVYRKMEHVSFSLIFARISQLLALFFVVYFIFPLNEFGDSVPLVWFLAIFLTVCLSSIVQFFYTFFVSRKYITLRFVSFLWFTRKTLQENRKYWVGFFLSSAPTLLVVLLLSFLYPTKDGYTYVWIRSLALQIFAILLVVPPAIWNSLLHKVSSYSLEIKKRIFWVYTDILCWFWLLIATNFLFFSQQIIFILWKESYLTPLSVWNDMSLWLSPSQVIGSDIALFFLWIVLFFSFIKQAITFSLLAFKKQNLLFSVNVFGMIFWSFIWFFSILYYNLPWGILTQVILELFFSAWIIFVAYKNNILPNISSYDIGIYLLFFLSIWIIWRILLTSFNFSFEIHLLFAILFNSVCIAIRWKHLKRKSEQLI